MKQVLIVDDSSTMRKRIAALLHESPLIRVVAEAGSGREAIETVEQTRPDTVILDIHLPDQNGIHAAQTVQGGLSGNESHHDDHPR